MGIVETHSIEVNTVNVQGTQNYPFSKIFFEKNLL